MKVAVIVPVYGVEAYLARCVESVLAQSHEDFVLVLVDDGSPDRSGEICDAFARRDDRVHVIHQANGGLSAARNTGLDVALADDSCKWIAFVDSDDWLSRDYLEECLRGVNSGAKIACTECLRVHGMEDVPLSDGAPKWEMLPFADYWRNYESLPMTACGKLFARELLETVRFPEGRVNEDEYVIHRLLFAAGTVAVSSVPLYYYFQRPGSIMTSGCSGQNLDIVPALVDQIVLMQSQKLDDIVSHTRNRIERVCGWVAKEFDDCRARNVQLSERLAQAEAELDSLRGSVFYRFGRLVSFPCRMVKKVVEYFVRIGHGRAEGHQKHRGTHP